MAQLSITDLPLNTDLDLAARQEIQGGIFPLTSIVAIFETMQFTQNAATFTIINEGTAGSVLNNISHSSLSAASPMQFLQMTTPFAPPADDVL
jgi:hypothetical protein